MERSRVAELHYIAPIENVASIGQHGLVSHNMADSLPHRSVALETVQDLRKGKRVPNGEPLHSYANLYFSARNPMMFRLIHDGRTGLAVIRVTNEVLDIPQTVITDGNAATATTRFYPSPEGLEHLDATRVYAKYWTNDNPFEYNERKRQRCAEVLVPGRVLPQYIIGCYTLTGDDYKTCVDSQPRWKVEVNAHVYFR
ncbi:DUF4433 domain-containing protein [Streptomyces sp. NPDC000151]|uniref:DUF4433 domain-containing protein n=1 Tax=Streptomyces sp. NPDC000151 TaxID=3154244 RepID=UPI00331F8A71